MHDAAFEYSLLAVYSLLILISSFWGGWLPSRLRLSHTHMQCIISLVGGFMLGIGLLHMLPHGIAQSGSIDLTLQATLIGLLFTFFLIRICHFHQHPASDEMEHHHSCSDPARDHGDATCAHDVQHGTIHELGWVGVAFGLSVHTLLDGIALGAAVAADAMHRTRGLYGLGVFLAIVLHKPLDAFSITSLMKASGWPPVARHLTSLVFAAMCPLGALLFVIGAAQLDVDQASLLGITLGFSTGVFLCISLSDLLPEVQFHRHDRMILSASMLSGVLLAYGVGLLEPSSAHATHGHSASSTTAPD